MDSLDPRCTDLKHLYEACFQTWYSEKYLPASKLSDADRSTWERLAKEYEEECGGGWRGYRECLEGALKERKIDALLAQQSSNEDHFK